MHVITTIRLVDYNQAPYIVTSSSHLNILVQRLTAEHGRLDPRVPAPLPGRLDCDGAPQVQGAVV
jgi:hypothetical protein